MAECILLKGGGSGLDPDELTATPDKVLSGYTAGVKGSDEPAGGTMPAKVSGQIVNSCIMYNNYLYYRMPYGYYPNTYSATECESRIEQEKVASAIGLIPEKLLAGQWVAGVTGTATSDANAGSGHILSGASAYVNGNKIWGSIPYQNAETDGDRAWATEVVSFNGQINLRVRNGHFLNGVNWVRADIPNLQPQYIKKGVNIAGITGTFEGYVPMSTDLYLRGNNLYNWSTDQVGCSLDSGQISFTDGLRIKSGKTINLTPYKQFIIEGNFNGNITQSNGSWWIDLCNGNSTPKLVSKTLKSGIGSQTLTSIVFDITNVNATVTPYIWMAISNSGSNAKCSGGVLRIRVA